MRVLLADDHPLFLAGLTNLLSGRGMQVVGVARDGFEALAQARALRPDLVLMDISMPRCDGVAATRLITAEFPEARVVILTASSEDDDLFEALRAGASGYLVKTQDTESFLAALSELSRGEVALAPGLVKRVLDAFSRLTGGNDSSASEAHSLSPRQVQVLTLVCRGLTYKQVGAELGLAERTVKYHMGEILAELHLRNRGEAVAYARSHGLDQKD